MVAIGAATIRRNRSCATTSTSCAGLLPEVMYAGRLSVERLLGTQLRQNERVDEAAEDVAVPERVIRPGAKGCGDRCTALMPAAVRSVRSDSPAVFMA